MWRLYYVFNVSVFNWVTSPSTQNDELKVRNHAGSDKSGGVVFFLCLIQRTQPFEHVSKADSWPAVGFRVCLCPSVFSPRYQQNSCSAQERQQLGQLGASTEPYDKHLRTEIYTDTFQNLPQCSQEWPQWTRDLFTSSTAFSLHFHHLIDLPLSQPGVNIHLSIIPLR